METHHSSGEIHHYLCIFNGEFQNKLAFILQYAVPSRDKRRTTNAALPI